MFDLFNDRAFYKFDELTLREAYRRSKQSKADADDDHGRLKVIAKEADPDGVSAAAFLGGAAVLAVDLASGGAISIGSALISAAGTLIGGRDFAKALGKMRELYKERLLTLELRAYVWTECHAVSVQHMDRRGLERAR